MSDQSTALAALERRIEALENIEAIKRLQADYAAACDDNYNPVRLAAMFTENGVWDGGSLGRVQGRTALHDHFAGASTNFLFAVHFMIAPNIQLGDDGSTARGSWYLWEPCTLATDDGPTQYWAATVYDIGYQKVDGEWLFDEMNLDIRIFAPVESGW